MKKKTKLLIALAAVLFFFPKNGFPQDDFEYWPRISIKAVDTKYVDFISYGEMRFLENSSRFGFWQTSEQLQFNFFKNLNFGTAYTYLENRVTNSRTGGSELKYQNRLELEANPHWNLWRDWTIVNRNRIEFRWIEDQGSDNTRYRQLWEVEVSIQKIPFVKSVYLNNEIFVDFHVHALNEDRVTPIGITLPIYKELKLKIFYMIQVKKGARDWSSNQILGTHFLISF